MMALILGNSIHIIDSALLPHVKNSTLTWIDIDIVVGEIRRAFGGNFTGRIKDSKSRTTILRGALSLYGSGQGTTAKKLVSLLADQDVFEKTLCELVVDHFG